MRSENDLRDAIELFAGNDAESVILLERLTVAPTHARPRASRRVLTPLVAALVVLAVATAGFVVFDRKTHDIGSDVGSAPYTPLEWKFSVGSVPGYTITRDNISRPSFPAADVSEQASVTATGEGKTTGVIDFDTVPGKLVQTTDSSTVAGVTYYFRAGHHVTRRGGLTPAEYADPWKAARQDAYGPQLSWRYPDGSQFTITGTFGFVPKTYNYDNTVARNTLMKIALATRHGQRNPVAMPFSVPPLPSRLVPVSLRNTPPEQVNPPGSLSISPLSACLNYATTDQPSPQDPTESILTVCRAKVSTSRAATLDAIAFGTQVVANSIIRTLPDGTLLVVGVGIGHTKEVSESDLQRIAKQIDTSPDLTKPSTWVEVP